jgi:hypothetical protein
MRRFLTKHPDRTCSLATSCGNRTADKSSPPLSRIGIPVLWIAFEYRPRLSGAQAILLSRRSTLAASGSRYPRRSLSFFGRGRGAAHKRRSWFQWRTKGLPKRCRYTALALWCRLRAVRTWRPSPCHTVAHYHPPKSQPFPCPLLMSQQITKDEARRFRIRRRSNEGSLSRSRSHT